MIIGHESILSDIRSRIKEERLAKTCLFMGVAGIGKFMSAKTLAEEILGKNSSDLIIINESCEDIKIADVRDLQSKLALSAVESSRIVIIRSFDKMRYEAQNAFLKTLEEPPDRTHFFLVCDRPEALLETISSRCTSFGFAACSVEKLRSSLFDLGYNGSQVDEVLSLPISKVAGEVIHLMESEEDRTEMSDLVGSMNELVDGMDLVDAFALAETLSKDPIKTTRFLQGLVCISREKALNGDVSGSVLGKTCKMLELANNTNVNKRLLMEEGFMNLLY